VTIWRGNQQLKPPVILTGGPRPGTGLFVE